MEVGNLGRKRERREGIWFDALGKGLRRKGGDYRRSGKKT